MEMTQLILVAFFVGFGLTADVLTKDYLDDIEALTVEANRTDEIRKDLHNFLDSLQKKNKKKSKNYRDILQRATGKVKIAFDTMKEDLSSARQRNKNRKKDNAPVSKSQRKTRKEDSPSTGSNQSFDMIESKSEPVECYYRALKKNEFGIRAVGVVGMNETTKEIVSGGVPHEVDQIFRHIGAILQKYGTSFKKVTHFTFSVDNIAHHPVVEKALMRYVRPPLPRRSLFVKQNLPKNIHVECGFVAYTAKKLEHNMTMPTP